MKKYRYNVCKCTHVVYDLKEKLNLETKADNREFSDSRYCPLRIMSKFEINRIKLSAA